MEFRSYTTDSSDYKEALALRQKILRAPLGLNIFEEDLSVEKEQLHFGLFDDKSILASVTVVIIDEQKAKIRQMAVSDEFQGQGLGATLLKNCLLELKRSGFKSIELNARKSAEGFYERYGFSRIGDEFTEVTVPHYKMVKQL